MEMEILETTNCLNVMNIHITPLRSNTGANNRQTKDNYLFVVDNSS